MEFKSLLLFKLNKFDFPVSVIVNCWFSSVKIISFNCKDKACLLPWLSCDTYTKIVFTYIVFTINIGLSLSFLYTYTDICGKEDVQII
jgi:hypothetical protein